MEPKDYIISDQQKALWRIELQISDVLLDICKRLDLKIWQDMVHY